MKNQDQILEEARAIDTASTQEETDHTHELPVVPGPLRTEPGASGFSLRNLIVDNPGPALLIGAGLGWLFVNREREKDKALHQRVREHGHHLKESTQESLADLKDTTSSGIQSLQETVDESAGQLAEKGRSASQYVAESYRDVRENNPLIIGACALLGGLAIGLMLPPTQREDSLLGEARNSVFEQAKKIVEEARDAAVSTLRSGKERIADSLQETGEEIKETAKLAYENAKEETVSNLRDNEEV